MPQPGVVINGFIAIDKFTKDDAIKYYFLTHAHSDHYGAIDNKWNNGTIYCSPVTAHVLPVVTQRPRSKRGGIQSHLIHALDLNIWHHMDGFSVMLLDANHIPGSVMFLFEGDRISNGRILFTGDFRADVRFYQNVFAISVLQEMSLNTIYLDTTYINCTREEFPNREASLVEICSVLRELLFDGSKPVTIMVPKIGREQLLVDIAIEFKCKIWIDHIRFQVAEILGLNEYFTTEKAETSIWTCTRQNIRSILYDTNVHVIDTSMLRHINPTIIIDDERMRYVEYSDHSSPNEIRSFLSQLSFSQVIGLSIQLSQAQTEELERLSLMGFSDILIRTETDDNIAENELSGLASSIIQSRIGLAYDRALRDVFDTEVLQCTTNYGQNQELNAADNARLEIGEENMNIVSTETILGADMPVKNVQHNMLSSEIIAKSDEKLQRVEKEIKKDAKDSIEAINGEGDYIFNLAMRKITRADYTNLTTRISMELNNNENAEEDNPLYEFWNEVNFSKEIKNLDDLSEKYREAVNIMAEMQIVHDINLPYNAQEHVIYDASRAPASIDIPLEWLNESEKIDEPIIIE